MTESKTHAMSKWSGFGAVGAGFGVALGWLCCLPFAASLSAGAAALAAVLGPLQPFLALASVSLLAIAFVQAVRAPRCADGECCRAVSKRRRWLFFTCVTVATLLLITLPYWSAYLIYWTL